MPTRQHPQPLPVPIKLFRMRARTQLLYSANSACTAAVLFELYLLSFCLFSLCFFPFLRYTHYLNQSSTIDIHLQHLDHAINFGLKGSHQRLHIWYLLAFEFLCASVRLLPLR